MEQTQDISLVISAREKDLGGFSVRRILPYATHRMVGPFIFFDHMGPADFKSGSAMDVRPHPHINLATVTYLFEGVIHHRDSLGSDQLIEPGAINWMVAGTGIVHSERTPPAVRARGGRLNGIQLWVAVPAEVEESAPSFTHHPRESLPEFEVGGVAVKLLLGRAFGRTSPVTIHSDLFYAEIKMKPGQTLTLPVEGREAAVYVVEGSVKIAERSVSQTEMAIGRAGIDLNIDAATDAHVMVIGGHPVGERFIFWNFVSSSKERLDQAKRDWARGPGPHSRRFAKIPNEVDEFIPLPREIGQPKGTVM